MKITIRDLAKACKVDVSTVSRSLSGTPGISEKTRRRVLEEAERLHYLPNRVARGLATGRSQSLGLLISDIRNPFFADVARGAEDAAFEAGFDLILGNADLEPERQMRYIRSLMEKRVDGMIMNSVSGLSREDVEQLLAYRAPTVLLNRPGRSNAFSTVSADNFEGGYLAGCYLVGLGHRRLAHLTGSRLHPNLRQRSLGFRKAILAADSKARVVELHGDHSESGGYALAHKLVASHPGITAIFAGNDAMAFGVIRALGEEGLRIPEDISLLGFDNVDMAAIVHPQLTTIHQPKYDLGKAAVEVLLRRVNEGNPVTEHRVLGVKLIERQSCRKV